MKKIFVLSLIIFSTPSMAIIINDGTGMCGAYKYDNLYATYEPISYICLSGYYLPADTLGCTSCPKGFVCDGGTFDFDTTKDQGATIGSYTCDSGYFLPANDDTCRACPKGFVCDGGTFDFDTTKDQGATPGSFICNSGYFLPANDDTCRACPTGLSCPGGTFVFNTNENQGLVYPTTVTNNLTNTCARNASHGFVATYEIASYNCGAGYYLPADGIECTLCPADNICSGGTYTYNETTDQGIVACSAPTPYAPTGSDSVCYPHVLHVDDGVVYLRSTKLTSPSLHIRIEDDVFYANMTTIPTRMNKDSVRYFHSQWDDNHYYICDDTTYPGE